MEYKKGRGAQFNTENRFLSTSVGIEHWEGIDEIPEGPVKTEYFNENPKKVINKIDSPDLRMMYSVNPYQGCEHGCIYCYARNSHEYWGFSAGTDFESKIIIKRNAPQVLEQELLKKTWKPAPISISGNTDCYQPVERKLQITRQLLQVLYKYRNPVGMITKNSLVTRDIDILQEMAKENLAQVFISITTLDEGLRSKMEPRTATAKNRLKTLEELSKAGIPCGIMAAPLIPGLNHHELPEIIKAAADHGARTCGYTVVRLNGQINRIFKDWLEKNFPDRFSKVWNMITELHGGQVNDSEFGRRMRGEGNLSEIINRMHKIFTKKYMSDRTMPALDTTKFRKGGNLNLF
jgi:DNA repair photolyase